MAALSTSYQFSQSIFGLVDDRIRRVFRIRHNNLLLRRNCKDCGDEGSKQDGEEEKLHLCLVP